MPLQIRRGTNAERLSMTVPLAQGELLYVTDDQRLYVGNGSTLGGVQITGYTDNDAQDAAAAIFTGGSHNGIGFTYNTATNLITATVDLSSYTGTINASAFKGTLVADDSTLLVDAVDGKINLNGTVKGNIIPDVTEAYDIGSSSYRFRDLYLSGSTIYLGTASISAVGSAVNLPLGSTIGGSPIGVPGGDLNVNIVADDSTVIVNTTTKAIAASGGISGTLTGSVLASDTTPLVNASTGKVVGPIDSTSLNIDATSISLNVSSTGVLVNTSAGVFFEVEGEVQSSDSNALIAIKGTRYSGSNYATIQVGDDLGYLTFEGYNGTEFKKSGTIKTEITGAITGGNFNSNMVVSVLNADGLYRQFTFQSDGVFDSGVAIKTLPLPDSVFGSITVNEGTLGYGSDRKSLAFYDGSSFLTVPSFVSVPGGPTASGYQGQISADANYMYICYSDGLWIRIAKDGTW